MSELKPLSELQPQDKGIIKKINSDLPLKQKLLDMGVIPGSPLEVVKLAPLGDPIDVKVKGYHLSLRKMEAIHIMVQQEENNVSVN